MKIFREAKGIPEPVEENKESESGKQSTEEEDGLSDWTVENKEQKESHIDVGNVKN